MATVRVPIADLEKMSKSERALKLTSLVRGCGGQVNGEIEELEERIKLFEIQFGMLSDEMVRRSREHTLSENDETWTWMSMLERRKRLLAQGQTRLPSNSPAI